MQGPAPVRGAAISDAFLFRRRRCPGRSHAFGPTTWCERLSVAGVGRARARGMLRDYHATGIMVSHHRGVESRPLVEHRAEVLPRGLGVTDLELAMGTDARCPRKATCCTLDKRGGSR